MTKSEEITSLISKKFFLDQYIYTDVYVRRDTRECEFCDCLIEFDEYYIVIQIKERDDNAEGTSEKWFEKKVFKRAKDQMKDTFKYYGDKDNTIFSKTSTLEIDRNKKLIPVIVFLNENLKEYCPLVFSKSLGIDINIFSYRDFETMLETIILPYDILNYLTYRNALGKRTSEKILIDDVSDDISILAFPKTEQDFAELFLARNYYSVILQYGVKEENVEYYNNIVSEINKTLGCSRNEFIKGFLYVDYIRANSIVEKWVEIVEYAQKGIYVEPFKFFWNKKVYMILAQPQTISDERLYQYLEISMVYCKYCNDVNLAHIIIIKSEEQEQYSVTIGDVDLTSEIRYDELLEDVIRIYEE